MKYHVWHPSFGWAKWRNYGWSWTRHVQNASVFTSKDEAKHVADRMGGAIKEVDT